MTDVTIFVIDWGCKQVVTASGSESITPKFKRSVSGNILHFFSCTFYLLLTGSKVRALALMSCFAKVLRFSGVVQCKLSSTCARPCSKRAKRGEDDCVHSFSSKRVYVMNV